MIKDYQSVYTIQQRKLFVAQTPTKSFTKCKFWHLIYRKRFDEFPSTEV